MNRIFIAGCAIGVLLMSTVSLGLAQEQRWMCKYAAAAGLGWINGQWKPKSFPLAQPFVLVLRNGVLTPQSAAPPMSSSIGFVNCPDGPGARTFCLDSSGGWLVFDPKTGNGGLAKIFTATKNPPNPNSTLSVEPFTCTIN